MPIISRRNFISSALLSIPTIIAVNEALHSDYEAGPPTLEKLQITLPKLPKVFQGYRIMFITDIRHGIWMPNEWIEEMVRAALECKPDLVVLGGDYICIPESSFWNSTGPIRNKLFASGSREKLADLILQELGKLLAPLVSKIRTLAVLGNHDHWVAPKQTLHYLSNSGIEILNNAVTTVTRDNSKIWFVGTDDYLTGTPELVPLPQDEALKILITHNPDMASFAVRSNYPFDLALSGHTHGGQITSSTFGPLICNVDDERFVSGLVTAENHLVYTSKGVGFVGLPFRSNARSEITLIELI